MCCVSSHHPIRDSIRCKPWHGMESTACMCGCMGDQHSISHLQKYHHYLKAELESVEKRMDACHQPKE